MDPFFRETQTGVEDILEIAATALAQAADAVSLVTAPRALGVRVEPFDLVKLNDTQALLVLVLEGNLVRQQALNLTSPTDQSVLSAIAAEAQPRGGRAECRGHVGGACASWSAAARSSSAASSPRSWPS